MAYVRHDSGEFTVIKCQQVLGARSPLETDDDGYAEVDDDVADQLVAMYTHLGHAVPPDHGESDDADADAADEADAEDGAEDGDEFDADAFVDRTPMADVVDDIESGDYDEHLDDIEAAADRVGVQDAVDARR